MKLECFGIFLMVLLNMVSLEVLCLFFSTRLDVLLLIRTWTLWLHASACTWEGKIGVELVFNFLLMSCFVCDY